MTTDEKVKSLLERVRVKRNEIQSAERPVWETHLSFSFEEISVKDRTNIQVVSDLSKLVDITAFLLTRSSFHSQACERLGVEMKFEWMGFPVASWIKDIQTRINQIQINNKKKDLDALEKKLDSLVSPEQRRALELEEIEKLLK